MLADWQLWSHDGHRLTAKFCSEIIKRGMQYPVVDSRAGDRVDHVIRSSDVRWMPRAGNEKLYELLWERASWSNRNAFGFDINFLPDLQLTHYKEKRKGHYSWHQDTFFTGSPTPTMTHRKLSSVTQLSAGESYEGGDLELDCNNPPDRNLLRRQGTQIFFPSFAHHRVTPLTSGERFSLVSWFEGPYWR